jgi:hypothetical protein
MADSTRVLRPLAKLNSPLFVRSNSSWRSSWRFFDSPSQGALAWSCSLFLPSAMPLHRQLADFSFGQFSFF